MLKNAVCKLCDCLKVKSRKEAIMYPVWMASSDIKEKNSLTFNSNCLKVCKNDGFVWFVITADQARKLWKANVFTLYVLYDDDSEGMIDSEEKLENCIRKGCSIGIEVGFLSK